MPLIDVKCDNCGAVLKVEKGTNTAVCEYCGSTFIVEPEKAFCSVLDDADAGMAVEHARDKYPDKGDIFTENAAKYSKDKGSLILTKKNLKFMGQKTEAVFEVSKMQEVTAKENMNYMGVGGIGRPIPNCLYFVYDDKKQWIFIRSGKARELAEIINEINS